MANETLDPGNQSEGDTKEGVYFGQEIAADSEDAALPLHGPNQWPRVVCLPSESDPTPAHESDAGPYLTLATNVHCIIMPPS